MFLCNIYKPFAQCFTSVYHELSSFFDFFFTLLFFGACIDRYIYIYIIQTTLVSNTVVNGDVYIYIYIYIYRERELYLQCFGLTKIFTKSHRSMTFGYFGHIHIIHLHKDLLLCCPNIEHLHSFTWSSIRFLNHHQNVPQR